MKNVIALVAVAGIAAAAAGQTVVWDEGVDGNLSNDPNAPTDLGTLGAGGNIVRGSTLGAGTPPSDGFDVFQINIAAGFSITDIILSAYSPAGATATSGFNFSTGSAASNLPIGSPDLIFGPGWGAANVGQDLLDVAVGGPVASLGPGTYFMEIREFGGPLADWELTFNVVPAPGAMALLGLGGLAATRRRR
jgi:hypothetical protein